MRHIVLVSAMVLVGCIAESDDSISEIVENLQLAGYPASEIAVEDGVVIVGGDAVVSLEASREMIGLDGHAGDGEDQFRQYRTTNLVGPALDLICLDGSAYTGMLSTTLDQAIANYNALPLQFDLMRISSPDPACDATIKALVKGSAGGLAGFPSGGMPYSQIQVGKSTTKYGTPVVTHVIMHELGHCIGLRHSDWFDRSISCGGAPSNEGSDGVGAILIPGTPSGAMLNGSVMNSCFNSQSKGEWTSTDVTALTALY